MKKFYSLFLSTIAIAGMVCSCNKTPDEKPEPDKPQPDEPAELVTIDGDFADWAEIKDAVQAEVDDEAQYPGLFLMKAVADEENVYVYFEFAPQEDQGGAAPFSLYVNSDNDGATGASYWIWKDSGVEFLIACDKGFLKKDSSVQIMTDVALIKYAGPDGEDIWTNNDSYREEKSVPGFFESAGTFKNGIAMVELSFLRSAINAGKPGNIRLGIVVQNSKWGVSGILPQEAGIGSEEMMEISLP